MPVNAPQFGTAINGAAGNSSFADFLLASSTNDVAAPDFKTIAAGLFAGTATAPTIGQINTQAPQIPAKPVGSSTAREREAKDNHAQPSEAQSPFLTIPGHLLNIVPPQYQVASHPQFSGFPAQDDTPADSNLPSAAVPAITTLQVPNQSLLTVPQTSSSAKNFIPTKDDSGSPINTKSEIGTGSRLPLTERENPQSLQGTDNNREPQEISEDKTCNAPEKQPQSSQDATAFASEPQVIAEEQASENIIPGNQAVLQMSEASATKKSVMPSVAPSFAVNRNVSEISTEPTKPAIKPATTQKIELSSKHEEFVQDRTIHSAKNTRQTATPGINLSPTQTAQNTAAKQVQQSENLAPEQVNTIDVADPAPQSNTNIPQPISDVMKSMVVETTAFASNATSLKTTPNQTNSTPVQVVQVDAPAQPVTAPADPAPAQSDVPALKNSVDTLPNAHMATPAAKTTASKGRTEAAPRSKTQRENPDAQTTGGNISEPHERDVHPVNGPQNTADTGSDKNHNADATLTNLTPHSKSAPAKNAVGVSDFAPAASTTQIPDADDTIPTAHTSINTAKLVQGLSQSELRVGLQTRDFGNIDIRTSVSHHEFSAQISVEHGDMARTLTTELPGLYERLNDQQVQVSSIHIQSQSFSASSGMNQHSQQSASHPQSSGTFRSQLEPALPVIHEVLSPTDRLDIRI